MATKTRNLRFELDQIMNPTGEREGYGSIQNKFTNESTKAGAFTTDILSMVQDIGRKDEDKPTGFIAPTSYRSTRTSMDIARTMQKRAEEEAQFSGAMLGSGVGRTQQKTPFVKAVANSLVASMFNIARQTLSNDPSITTPAQAEDQKRFEQTVTKIIESTMPKEDRAVKPVWEGAFQRQAERVSRTPELTKRLAGTAESIRGTPESTRQFLRTQEDLARQRADLENAAYVTRLMSGVAESMPLSLATRIPVLGWALMANTTFKNSLEQSVQANPNAQADDYNMMLIKAIGDAALEIGTEMIFPLYGATASTAKGIAKGAIKPSLMDATKGFVSFFKKTGGEIIEPTIKNISKQVLRQAGEEAVEEGLNYFLGAYLAVLTTEKGKNVWSRQYGDDPEAIVSIAGLLDAMLTGAISGGLTTAGRFAIPAARYASINGLFTNTREAVAKIENKTIDNITSTESKAVYDAIVKDMDNPDNAEFVMESSFDAISKTQQQAQPVTQDIDQIISQLESSPDMTINESGELAPAQTFAPAPRVAPEAPVTAIEPQAMPEPIQQPQAETQALQGVAEPIATKPKEQPVKKVKKKRQYYSLLRTEDGVSAQPVEGTAIKLDKMPDREFFVRTTGEGKSKRWHIVEASSGVALSTGVSTRKASIDEANSNIEKVGVDKAKEMIANSIERFGSMPIEEVESEQIKDVTKQASKPKEPSKIAYVHGKTAADFVEKKKEPAKVVEQKAEQAPKLTVSRKDLDRMYDEGTRGAQLENAVDEWLDSDDVQAQEIRNIKTEADVADAVLRVREEIRTGLEVGTDGMIKGKFLQLLALSRWALRLESVPKGSSVTDHMAKLVDVLREGQPKDIQRQIESAVTDDMLFHRIIGDATVIGTAQEAMDRGNEIQKLNHRKNLEARFTTVNDADLEPSLVLQMDMYATELLNEGKIEESIRIGNLVSQRLSKVARYLRAARHLKNLSPIRRAEKIIRDFDSEVDPVAKENVEDATKETVESVIKNRKEKILEGSKEVDKEIEKRIIDDEKKSDQTGRKSAERDSIDDVATQVDSVIDAEGEATEEQTNKLAEKIKRYAKQKTEPKKAPTFEERMVRRLMTKFIEKNPDKRQKLIDDPYAVITEIVSNRSEYADLWKDAQSILQKDAKAKEYEDVISFLKMLADPVQADKFMLNAIRKNLKENNTTIRKLARTYTDNPDGTIDGFFADLKKKLVGLDDAGFNYLKKYMQPLLESTLKRNFQAQQDAIAKLKEERAKEKKALTPEEIIAARIRSSIKTANRETQPKVYTAEQLLIKALMQKHKDNMQRQGKKVPDRMSLFNMLGQIVANRQQYEAVWFAARSLLQKYPDLQFSDVYKVLKNFNNPIVAQTYINHAISQTIKSMKMTVQGVAKDYFFKGDETFKNFYKSLTGMMPEMDQYAERYFIDLVKPVFDAKMKEARALSHRRLKEQVERRQKRRSDKRSQDQIVEQLQNAVFRDELNIDALRDIWANRMGLPYITSTMRQDIYDSVLAMSKAKNQDEADEIYQKMVMRISSELPSDMVDKILAVTRFMMLMNPVTLIRNMTSNMAVMPVYNTADRLQGFIEKALGVPKEDRITGSRWIDSKEAGFIGDTVREYTDGDKLKKHLLRSSKYDIRTLVGIERKIFNSSRLDNFMKSPHRLMNEGQIGKIRIKPIGDQFAYSKHFKRAMVNRLAAKGFSQSMTNEQQQSIINEAMQYAEEVAAIRTFRQITGIAEKLLSLGKPRYSNKQIAESTPFSAMGKQAINTGTKLAARIAFPFIVTPTALVYESYKLSPIAMLTAFAQYGLAKGFYKKRGQTLPSDVKVKFARQMAQSITGSVMSYTLGAILASLGYVDMEEPESEKERAALGLAGGRKYSLRIPGVGSFSIDWLQPLSTPFLMGASLARAIENSHGGDWAINSLSTGLEVFVDTTMLNNIFNFGGSAYMTPAEKALGFAFTGANQFTSSSIRRLNRVIDPYQRDIYSGTAVQDMFRSFVAGVPFGTFLLPIKYDVWGRPSNFADTSKAQGVLERSLLNFIAPFVRTREDQDALTKEVLRLHEAVKKDFGNDMLPSVAPKSVDGYRLAGDEYSWYAKRLGELQYNYANNAIRSPSYRSAQASGKVKILKDAYARARKQAKEDLMKQGFFNPEILP